MDKLDHKIIDELVVRGFMKSAALANILGIGERTIRRRMHAILSEEIVKIIAIPNPVTLGFTAWSKIGIKVEPGSLNKVARVLVNHPLIYFVAYALGRFDIIISAHFKTLNELTHFVNSELLMIDGILFTETWLLVSPRKYYHFRWPAPVFSDDASDLYQKTGVSYGHYEMDEVDRRIFEILRENGLNSPRSIQAKLGIGEAIVRRRMKSMLYNDVYKLEVVPNPELIEFETWVTIGITINRESISKLIDTIIRFPAVYLASVAIGRFNIVIAARFDNANLLTKFITTDLSVIKGINSIETYLHNKPLKYHSIVWPQNL